MADGADIDVDEQDLAEIFDEDNTNTEAQRLGGADDAEQAEDLVDLFDVTRAVGDADDDEALIGEDLDDDEIIDLAREDDDQDDDLDDDEEALRDPDDLEGENDSDRIAGLDDEDEDVVDGVDKAPPGDVDLTYVGDMNDVAGAHSAAQRYESKSLSDEDLETLNYKED